MEMIIHVLKKINVCGIFKVQLKLFQTSKHDLHYGQYSHNDKCIANVFQYCRMNKKNAF